MIKLRLSFDVSLSKVILGVAGISATICAFQYFISTNSKLKGPLKNNVVQNKTNSNKDNKVSNVVSAKQTVEFKFNKEKTANDNFKNSKPKNGLRVWVGANASTSNDDYQNEKYNLKVDINKEPINKGGQDQLNDRSKKVFNQKARNCDLKEKVWKEAGNKPIYATTKLSNKKQKNLKEILDCIQDVLKNCGGLIQIIIRRIRCMLEYMPSDESKTDFFFEVFNHLQNENVKYWKKMDAMSEGYTNSFNNDSKWINLSTIENSFNDLCDKFHCIRRTSYKTLVGDKYQSYKQKLEVTD